MFDPKRGCVMSLLLLLTMSNANAEVLINEVLIDPVGSDGANEWLELCNNGEEDIDVSGWGY